jgi:hypothetical protein
MYKDPSLPNVGKKSFTNKDRRMTLESKSSAEILAFGDEASLYDGVEEGYGWDFCIVVPNPEFKVHRGEKIANY